MGNLVRQFKCMIFQFVMWDENSRYHIFTILQNEKHDFSEENHITSSYIHLQ